MKSLRISLSLIILALFFVACGNPYMTGARIHIYQNKEYQIAISNLDTVLTYNPSNAEALYLKGLCHEKLKDWRNMALFYDSSLAVSDQFKEVIDSTRQPLVNRFVNRSIIHWDIAKSLKETGLTGGVEAVLARSIEYVVVEIETMVDFIRQQLEQVGYEDVFEKLMEELTLTEGIKTLKEQVKTVRDKENAIPLMFGYLADFTEDLKDGFGKLRQEETALRMEAFTKRLRDMEGRFEAGLETEGEIELLKELLAEFEEDFEIPEELKKDEENKLDEYGEIWDDFEKETDANSIFMLSLANIDTALIIEPNNTELRIRAAVIANDGDLFGEALKYSQKAIDMEVAGEDDPSLRVMIMLAHKHMGNKDEIVRWAKEVIRVFDVVEDNPNLYLQAFDELINIYEKQGKTDLAQETTQQALAKFPDNVLLKKNLAIFLVRLDDLQGARDIYNQVLNHDPNDLDANLTIGTIFCNEQKYIEAIPYLEKAYQIAPDNLAAVTNLMAAYYNTDQDEKGKEMRKKLEAMQDGSE